jgi:D-3-phosphoglycerate dehydrogenase / 2-oxoglutarate reductase
LRGIGMQVLVCDPSADATVDGFEQAALAHVLERADVVFPLAPALPSTENLINSETLGAMRRGTLLVNVSRGELLDEDAVGAALDSGHLGGFAMDVGRATDQRPSPKLAGRPGVVATPHLGGLTPENADAQARSSVEQIVAMTTGVMPPRVVNAEHAQRLRARWDRD